MAKKRKHNAAETMRAKQRQITKREFPKECGKIGAIRQNIVEVMDSIKLDVEEIVSIGSQESGIWANSLLKRAEEISRALESDVKNLDQATSKLGFLAGQRRISDKLNTLQSYRLAIKKHRDAIKRRNLRMVRETASKREVGPDEIIRRILNDTGGFPEWSIGKATPGNRDTIEKIFRSHGLDVPDRDPKYMPDNELRSLHEELRSHGFFASFNPLVTVRACAALYWKAGEV